MKFLFFADAHLGHYPEFDNNGSRLQRGLDGLQQVFDAAEEHDVNAIISCGDLIDKKDMIQFWVYNEIYEAFKRNQELLARRPMCELLGNHGISLFKDNGVVHNLKPLSQFITVIDTCMSLGFNGLFFHMVPFCRRLDDFKYLVESIDTSSAGTHILVFHQEIHGAETGTLRYVTGEGADRSLLSKFDFAIGGHYHRFQTLGENSFYCGALMHNDFGEVGNPQLYWIFDTDAGWTPHTINVPAFVAATSDEEVEANEGNYIWVQSDDVEVQDTANVRVRPIAPEPANTRLSIQGIGDIDQLMQSYVDEKLVDHPNKSQILSTAVEIYNASVRQG